MKQIESVELVHAGLYVAKVKVALLDSDSEWSPFLSLDDAVKLDLARSALQRGDLGAASRFGGVFELKPAFKKRKILNRRRRGADQMAGKFEIFKDARGEFRFRLKSGNGEIVLASEGYTAMAGAQNGVESVKKNAGDPARYEKKVSAGGKPYFVLKAGNNQVIGNSEMYESEASRDAGIASVAKAADGAAVEDKTA